MIAPPGIRLEPARLDADDRMAVQGAEPAVGRNWGPKLGWAVSIAVLVIIGAAVFHWRAAVVRIWPPSGRILTVTDTAGRIELGTKVRHTP